jgi:acid phosphatase type 7
MKWTPLALAPAILVLAGCMTNQSGDFEATKTGDLSHPLAERRAPNAEEIASCGSGELLQRAGPAVHRSPYVQRLSQSEARVMWTAQLDAPASVEVTRPAAQTGFELKPTAGRTAELDGAQSDEAPAYESTLAALAPDTLYCYQLWNGDVAATEPAGFRTAPPPGVGARVSFVAFGDSGWNGPDQDAILEQLQTVPLRLIVHTGDIAYESGTLGEFESTFFDVYAPLLRSFPVFPAIGNHDSSEAFRQVYDLPRQGDHNWYSFDYGDVHFVALDTNEMTDEQAAWLDRDLAASDREWRIVYGHHPPFSSGEHGSSMRFRELFGPVLERHRVDLVLSGHDHDYERVKPQNGVHYVVTGGGGRGTRPVGESAFTDFSEQVLHFVYVEVEGDQLLLHAIDATGVEFDQLAISHPV